MQVSLEKLKLERTVEGTHGMVFKNAASCWVRRVESYHGTRTHLQVSNSLAFEVRQSWFHRSFDYGNGGYGYGVELGWRTTDALVEDNVFNSLRHAMMVHVGVVGAVFGNNFAGRNLQGAGETGLNAGWIPPDISVHGHWAQMNLFEGNAVQEIGISDYWGPMGPGNTFYRNVVRGEGILLNDHSDGQNLVGNAAAAWVDDGTSANTLRHGENVGGAMVWSASLVDRAIPASLYRSAKPAWWGSLAWPSMGGDIAEGRNPAQLRFEAGKPIPSESVSGVRTPSSLGGALAAPSLRVGPDGRVSRQSGGGVLSVGGRASLPSGVHFLLGGSGAACRKIVVP